MTRFRFGLVVLSFLLGLPAGPAWAWDQHQMFMQSLGRTTANLNRKYLYSKVKVPTEEEEAKTLREISQGLELNYKKVELYRIKHPDANEVEVYDLFRSGMIDEPDQGMDQDLPASFDPKNEREWMGGVSGPTSQGFRHMFFSGIDYKQPLQTFQIPLRSVGQAPVRFQKLLALSDKFFKEGQTFWGIRTLLWALHYLQDLHQPFHVVQIPNWRFIPFTSIFSGFVARTTQSIANYHYAYEGIALVYLQHYEEMLFRDCVEADVPRVTEDLSEIILKTRDEARPLGPALFEVMGPSLKSKELDFPNGKGVPDYFKILTTFKTESVETLREITCKLHQSMARYTWGHFDRAFNYIPPNIPSSSK